MSQRLIENENKGDRKSLSFFLLVNYPPLSTIMLKRPEVTLISYGGKNTINGKMLFIDSVFSPLEQQRKKAASFYKETN